MEKIDNITNEIMDKIRDYFWKKHDIDLNDFQSSYSDRNSDDEIYSIIHNELKKEVSFDQSSLSQDRPYIRYKTSVLKQMLEECNETYEMYKMSKELELRKDIGSPNTRN